MSKVVKLDQWQPEGGWRWEIQRDSGESTYYRTDRDFEGLHIRYPEQSAWSQVLGHMQFSAPTTRPEMLAFLAKEGHDISPVRVPFAFGEKDTGRGDV